jgi:hypothetical protein
VYKVFLPFDKVEPVDKFHLYEHVKRRALSQYFKEPEMILWLQDNFSYRCETFWIFKYTNFYKWYVNIDIDTLSYRFYFKKKSDAAMFKLTWG